MTKLQQNPKNLENQPLPSRHEQPLEEGVSVDGFGQVLSMLQFADDAFRNSILRRIASRDRALALRLHRALNET
jgi:hypothetical protein